MLCDYHCDDHVMLCECHVTKANTCVSLCSWNLGGVW